MTAKEARAVLLDNLSGNDDIFTAEEIASSGWYLYAKASNKDATLDGEFTANELEAIVIWMRNPTEVAQ